jgi:hypothetical protein
MRHAVCLISTGISLAIGLHARAAEPAAIRNN